MRRSYSRPIFLALAIVLLFASQPSFGQTDTLSLSSGVAAADGTVSLSLTLASSTGAEAALQWTLTYPAGNVTSISAAPGAAALAAGKAVTCAIGSGSYRCIASGMNANVIPNGVVAIVNLTIAGGVTSTAIGVTGTLGASAQGTALAVSGIGGTVTGGASTGGGSVQVSALVCNPTSLGPSSSSSCAVTLNQAAPTGGSVVLLLSSNTALMVPPSVTVAAGAASATFNATTGAVASSQSATITATLGASSRIATINLTSAAPVSVANLVCNPANLTSGTSSTCVVTLNQAAPTGGVAISLTNTNATLAVPPSVTVAAGAISATFTATAGTVAGSQSATITAVLGYSAQSVTIGLTGNAAMTVSSLTCAARSMGASSSTTCTVVLSQAAPAGGVSVALSTSTALLTVPATVTVAAGQTSATFAATAGGSIGSQATITASLGGSSVRFTIRFTAGPSSITCKPKNPRNAREAVCRLTLIAGAGGNTEVQLSSSSASAKVPSRVTVRPGQSSVEFQLDVMDPVTDPVAVITAQAGEQRVQETVALDSWNRFRLNGPAHQLVRYGALVRFTVSASDPGSSLSAGLLPEGAFFDVKSGVFAWTPSIAQQGTYDLRFTARSPSGELAAEHVILEVDSGTPVVTKVVNAASRSQESACSPGAVGSIEGKWLSAGPAVLDPSGNSLQLGGTTVRIDGTAVPVLYASATMVSFLCPLSIPGSELTIIVETPEGLAQPVRTTTRDLALGIFSLDGSGAGQGMVMRPGATSLAMIRNYRYDAQPVEPGESILVYATGLDEATSVVAAIGDVPVVPDTVTPTPGLAGVWQISLRVPREAMAGNSVPVTVTALTVGGSTATSNTVTMAIEGRN
ncbi:MAG TPA: putative Ig domain-containing protein [Bryobacteraceae bacterium]|nr:putative Ig domain-containing protein [Bryobacteraceae bacterium]